MLILASGSPRRRQLLDLLGVRYRIQPTAIDETPLPGETPAEAVRRLAAAKGESVVDLEADRWVLSADTLVAVDGDILGKPTDGHDAVAMLQLLSGRSHQVHTGIALRAHGEQTLIEHSMTTVRFRPIEMAEIEAYVATGEPFDRAGAYAAQGLGGILIDRIDGEFSTVVGLTLSATVRLLSAFGIPNVLAP